MSKAHNSNNSSVYSTVAPLQKESTEFNRFHLKGEYSCPVCRHGKVSEMLLMETFSCNFCQHIFTTDFDKQLLKMADSQLPLTWYWNGRLSDLKNLSQSVIIASPTSVISINLQILYKYQYLVSKIN